MQKRFKYSAFAGIIYLISFLPELIIETITEFQAPDATTSTLLMITYIISTLSTIFFLYGFIILGNEYKIDLLIVGSIIIILTTIFYYIYAWYTLDLPAIEEDIVGISVLLLYGFSGIVFGLGIYKLKLQFGNLASVAGILEIIIGVFFVTVVLFFLGLIISIPAIILEILLLFKAADSDQSGEIIEQSDK